MMKEVMAVWRAILVIPSGIMHNACSQFNALPTKQASGHTIVFYFVHDYFKTHENIGVDEWRRK